MDYQQSIEYLLALVDHERYTPATPRQKRIYDLRRMSGFLELLGGPQDRAHTVHIAGTKGKGSTAAMVDSVLHSAGYATGFYSSPHLHTFRERIRRNSLPVSEETFAALASELAPISRRLENETDLGAATLFEFMTAMAFQCFANESVDFQTIEVGLGGRLDATNVVTPEVCAITSVSLDHMAILGDTLAEIASEKAGIIKPTVPVVVSPQESEARQVIIKACHDKGCQAIQVGQEVTWQSGSADSTVQEVEVLGRLSEYNLRLPLLGEHQQENAATAIAVLECLIERGHDIRIDSIENGMAAVSWPCRLEVLGKAPFIVADGAHNVYSMETMLATLRKFFDYRNLIIVVGFSRDKGVAGMLNALAPVASLAIATRSRHPRSLPPAALAEQMQGVGIRNVEQADTVADALCLAGKWAGPGDLILGTGSLFVAAEFREVALGIEPELYPDLLPPDLR